MLGHRELTIDDYLAILRRRLWLLVIPTVLGPLIAYGVSRWIPNRYRSQTLVLVEQQKVPESYVKSVVTDELNERLATMQEQILSRSRLQPIIEKFGLYREEMGRMPMEVLVGRLRGSIEVTPVRTMMGTRAGGLPGFYIGFTTDNPRLAQQVCAEITSMFMETNLRIRERRAQDTTEFLAKQLDEAKRKLDEQDARLAVFKRRYIGQLPDQEQANLGILMGLNTQLDAVMQVLNRAQQDKAYMESMLAQQLATWKASQGGTNSLTLEQQLAALQARVVDLETRYTTEHPDVIKAKNDVAQLKKRIEEAAASKTKPAESEQSVAFTEPPEIQKLRSEIRLASESVREKTREHQRLQKQIQIYQERVELSPKVEQQYKELTRDYTTALGFYSDLLAKKTQSEMATDLERRQQGEQFRVMDPPNLPERPSFPNRPLFALGGLGGGLVLGLGIAMVVEMRDKSMRTDRDVEFYLQLPTLGLIPTLKWPNGRKESSVRRSKHTPPSASHQPRV